ncbi:Uncharacterised protein [Pseudomonas luteola]|uniref:Uncharacterized protein n=1 Tax=Pseudomonas luteola TaxID=47886 RepID=A0A2X2BWG5_PSELU|nr:Uncharacterised protein [Pseudomonas luteola]
MSAKSPLYSLASNWLINSASLVSFLRDSPVISYFMPLLALSRLKSLLTKIYLSTRVVT